MLIFEMFLPARELSVATFSETRAVISPEDKYEKQVQKRYETFSMKKT